MKCDEYKSLLLTLLQSDCHVIVITSSEAGQNFVHMNFFARVCVISLEYFLLLYLK